jgi:adenylosuccinate synthase
MRYQAINNLYSNVSTQVNDKAYDDKGKLVKIDEDKVVEEVKRLQAEYDSKQYQRERAVAYDPIPEQLDQIYHDIDGWKARIKSVKDKYPKPT